jgi:uncharacterized protein YqgC (DUF456 family)
MFIGTLGSFVPIIPSTPLVLGAALLHKLAYGAEGPAVWSLVTLTAITAFSFLVDHIATMIGAKKFGATWRGITGAALGGIIGLFFGLLGLLIGPFVGAFVFEMAGRRTLRESSAAGVGAFIGLLAGAIGKIACCAVMTAVFAFDLIARAF